MPACAAVGPLQGGGDLAAADTAAVGPAAVRSDASADTPVCWAAPLAQRRAGLEPHRRSSSELARSMIFSPGAPPPLVSATNGPARNGHLEMPNADVISEATTNPLCRSLAYGPASPHHRILLSDWRNHRKRGKLEEALLEQRTSRDDSGRLCEGPSGSSGRCLLG